MIWLTFAFFLLFQPLGAVTEHNPGNLVFNANPCLFYETLSQQNFSQYEVEGIKSAIGMFRVWEKHRGMEVASRCPLPHTSIKQIRFTSYHVGDANRSIVDITTKNGWSTPPTLVFPTAKTMEISDRYKGLAMAADETQWEVILPNDQLFSGRYAVRLGAGVEYPFLFCMDYVTRHPLKVKVSKATEQRVDYWLEVEIQESRCSQNSDEHILSAAAFAGSPQSPSIWELDRDLSHEPSPFIGKIPIRFKTKDKEIQRFTLFVIYREAAQFTGIRIERDYQLELQP
jgi:hypothetical protein